ncbi:MAG: VWA domain-containing protein [Candidatus Acidiferrales bacterium]
MLVRILGVAAGLLLLLTALPARAQQAPPEEEGHRLRVPVRLVLLNVRVSSGDGRVPRSLAAGDFAVIEDGQPQELRLFENPRAKARVAVVIDLSGSTRRKITPIRAATIEFVAELSDQDEVALITVGPRVNLLQAFTSDRRVLKRVLGRLQPQLGAATRLYDGLGQALELLAPYEGRSMVVVFSDGMDNGSELPYARLSQRLSAAPSSIYSIAVNTLDDERRRLEERLQATAVPKQLVVVLDLTGPSADTRANVTRAAELFLGELEPNDRVDLFLLRQQQLRQLAEGERTSPALARLRELGEAAGGRLIPRREEAAQKGTLLHRGTRENIIIFTDGSRSGVSQLDAYLPGEALERAAVFPIEGDPAHQLDRFREHIRSHVDVNRRVMDDLEALPEFFAQSQRRLREMAEASGGQHFELKDFARLVDVYRSVVQELRHSYLLGYYTAARPGFHRLEVRLSEPGLSARTRSSLFVPFEQGE